MYLTVTYCVFLSLRARLLTCSQNFPETLSKHWGLQLSKKYGDSHWTNQICAPTLSHLVNLWEDKGWFDDLREGRCFFGVIVGFLNFGAPIWGSWLWLNDLVNHIIIYIRASSKGWCFFRPKGLLDGTLSHPCRTPLWWSRYIISFS